MDDDALIEEETTLPADDSGAQMTFFAAIVSLFLLLGKLMGLVKEKLLAYFFGATAATDAFKAIYSSIIYNLYSDAEQLLRPTYLPEFVKQRREDEDGAWRLAGTVATLEVVTMAVVAGGLMLGARPLLLALWPRNFSNPANLATGVQLVWIMAPALVLYSLSLMPELTLHAYKRFSLAAIAEASYHLLVMAALFLGVELLWHPDSPHAILAAGLGVCAGGIGRLVIMLPGLWSRVKRLRPSLNLRGTPGVTTMLRLMPSILLGLTVSMARPLVDSHVCDRLGVGMYSALDYGRKLSDAGIMILPLAVSLVVFPYVSEWAAAGDRRRMAQSLAGMTRALAFLFVPLSVGIILLAYPLCDIIYGGGKFKTASLDDVALALMCYASGLFIYSIEGSINKWYFAMKDTWTPNWVGVLWALGHLVMSAVGGLYTPLGLMAVALAYPISKGGKVLTLYLMLRPRLEPVPERRSGAFLAKVLVCTAAMGLVVWWVAGHVSPALEAHRHGKGALAVLLLSAGGAGLVVYLVLAALLRIEEVGQVWNWLGRRLRRLQRGR